MTHGIITLMSRSLRLEARLLRTHVFRMVFVFFIYMMLLVAQAEAMFRGAPGLYFFTSMLWLNAIFIAAGGVSFFASAITEEKEENTLGLLMMTGLNPLGILFGKSTARMLQALLLLTVQFPFTLLAITLGGVLLNQVVAAYAALLAFTVMLSNLSLFWSVVSKRTGSAAAGITICLVLHGVGAGVAPRILPEVAKQSWSGTWWGQALTTFLQGLRDSSVFNRLDAIVKTGFSDPAISFQVISNCVAGAVFFILSWTLFNKFALQADAAGTSRTVFSRPSGRMRWLSPGRAWSNALVWKDYNFLTGGKAMFIAKASVFLMLYPMSYAYFHWAEPNIGYATQSREFWEAFFGLHFFIAVGILALEAAIYASRIFHDEIRWQTMSSLLTLPRSIEYIAYSKVAGCAVALLPALTFVAIDLALLPGQWNLLTVIVHPAFWGTILVASTFLHMVVLLSLFVKWGALPLAFVMTYMTSQCMACVFLMPFAAFSGPGGADATEIMLIADMILIVLWAVSSFVFQMMIHARLYELGSK